MLGQRGFTLVEAIIAMVITGIIAAMISVFIAKPVEGYVDTVRRAELTDMADLALKRMALEIRAAVPNSVRVVAGPPTYVEFIPARDGGRYCADTETCSNPLVDFDPADVTANAVTFSVLGTFPAVAVGDQVIIYNTGQAGLNAYGNDNCAKVTATDAGASTLGYNDTAFPYASPSRRFFVAPASGPVRFSCSGTQVQRIQGSTGFCGETPASTTSILVSADNVACTFTYGTVSGTNALLSLSLTLTKAGESVTLRHQIHVDNMP